MVVVYGKWVFKEVLVPHWYGFHCIIVVTVHAAIAHSIGSSCAIACIIIIIIIIISRHTFCLILRLKALLPLPVLFVVLVSI